MQSVLFKERFPELKLTRNPDQTTNKKGRNVMNEQKKKQFSKVETKSVEGKREGINGGITMRGSIESKELNSMVRFNDQFFFFPQVPVTPSRSLVDELETERVASKSHRIFGRPRLHLRSL